MYIKKINIFLFILNNFLFFGIKIGKLSSNLGVIKTLLESKSNFYFTDFKSSWSSIHVALSNENVTVEILDYLFNCGYEYDQVNENKWTFLHIVSRHTTSLDILKFLENKNIDINAKNSDGLTPLHMACKKKKKFFYFLLNFFFFFFLIKGINEKLNLDFFKFMIENKSDINLTNEENSTPLHFLCSNFSIENNFKVLKYLIEIKSDLTAINSNDKMPHQLLPNLNEELVLTFLCSTNDIYFILQDYFGELIEKIFNEYQNGTLWSPNTLKFYPIVVHKNIFCALVVFKIVSKKLKSIFPKPIQKKIIQISLASNRFSQPVFFGKEVENIN